MRSLRSLFTVLFFLVLAGSAGATQITIQQTTRGWVNSNTAPRLRIYLNKPIVTSDSRTLASGSAQQNTGYYQSVTCSVSLGILTIPQFTLDSTVDAVVGSDAKYSAYFLIRILTFFHRCRRLQRPQWRSS